MKNLGNAVRIIGVKFCIIFLAPFVAEGSSPYRLQIFVTKSEERAHEISSKLDRAGFGPALIVDSTDNQSYRLLTRSFDSLAEANFAKPMVRALGFRDLFAVEDIFGKDLPGGNSKGSFGDFSSVIKTSNFKSSALDFQFGTRRSKAERITDQLKNIPDDKASEEILFKKANGWWRSSHAEKAVSSYDMFIQKFPSSPKVSRAKLMRAYWLLELNRQFEAFQQFEEIRIEHPTSEDAGEATLRLAYLMLLERNGDAKALQYFREVASGEVPSNSDVRLEAMLRCAALFHRGRDLVSALKAYEFIGRIAPNDDIKALVKMHRAGLHIEKAWNGESSFEVAREICVDLLGAFPSANSSIRATAALMELETYAYDKDFESLLDRSDSFLDEFHGIPEALLGYYWIARAYLETGDTEGALLITEHFKRIDQSSFEERFTGIDIEGAVARIELEAISQGSR